jgi:ketosteroid isomerase-like protein
MSQEDVEFVRGIYENLTDAYKTGDYTQLIEDFCHPDVVLKTSGMFPETGDYTGYEGLRAFTANQAEALEQMWVQPAEFIDAEDRVVVPLRFGGKARHTGIEAAFSVVHVWAIRDRRASRLDMYRGREEALKAVGLEE